MTLMLPGSTEIEKQKDPSSVLVADDEVQVNIQIHRSDGRYDISISGDGNYARGPIDITSAELPAYNKTLQNTFDEILFNSPQSQDQLRDLAEAGKSTFNRIFRAPKVLELIEFLMTSYKVRLIEITSDEFSVPWEILYNGEVNAYDLSYKKFWGMNYVISRTAKEKRFGKPIISYSSRPKIGLLTNNELSSVETETRFFTNLRDQGDIDLFLLRALDSDKKVEEFRYLQSFWKAPLNIAQIACHAHFNDNDRRRCRLVLTKDFPINLDDLENYKIALDNSPLVILNACGTGNLNPQYASNFTTMFLRQGAIGVVATEFILPDAFAAEFTKELYQRFLKGAPLGDCLLETRKHFLEAHNNPAALLYSMYAPCTTRLKRLSTI